MFYLNRCTIMYLVSYTQAFRLFYTFTIINYTTVNILVDFPGGSDDKESPSMQETQVRSLILKDSLEKEMATHSSILA